jgi:hypothetical protein
MGGATAFRAAAGPLKGRIKRFVMNDIGLGSCVRRGRAHPLLCPQAAAFRQGDELEAYFRTIYKPYGFQTDAQWRRMAETSVRRLPDGGITTHYDPKMVMQFTHHPEDNLQWAQWEKLDCEVFCLRGVPRQRMQRKGPRCRVLEKAAATHRVSMCRSRSSLCGRF